MSQILPVPSRGQHLDFVHLWTKSSRRVHAYLLALVMSWSDAEDLLQEVASTAWEKFPEFDRSRDFVAWVNGIARNKALSSRRKANSSLQLTVEIAEQLEQEIATDQSLLDRQLIALRECVAKLQRRDRDLLQLRYEPNYSMELIARRTGRTVAACYKALQRINHQLFECINLNLSRSEQG